MLLKRAGPRLPAPLECCRTAAARKDDFLPKGVLASDGRRGRKATTSGVPGAPAAAGCDDVTAGKPAALGILPSSPVCSMTPPQKSQNPAELVR